jgi:hypothetical protein
MAHIRAAAEAGRIEFAPQTKIAALGEWVDRALEALGHPEAWVSNQSSVGDFLSCAAKATERRAELRAISRRLGFPVKASDRVYELAVRLRDRASRRVH